MRAAAYAGYRSIARRRGLRRAGAPKVQRSSIEKKCYLASCRAKDGMIEGSRIEMDERETETFVSALMYALALRDEVQSRWL